MNNYKISISALSFLLLSFSLSAQDGSQVETKEREIQSSELRGWTIGLRGMWMYDLESTLYDGTIAEDPRGFNGENTSFDLGFEAYLEKQFTPFFGMQAAYRMGGLTGATATEYYSNNFNEFRLGLNMIWSNLDPNHVNSKWNFYNGVGASFGSFEAERFLASDNSVNGTDADDYNGFYVSGGIMYELASSWRIELDAAYNIVRNDGFDGFDYATGWDPYLNVGIGIAYTFGNSEAPAMYAGNYYEAPYYDMASVKARVNELDGRVQNLEAATRRNDDKLNQIKTDAEKRAQELAEVDKVLAEKIAFLEKGPEKSSIAPKAVVFFAFDSSKLSTKAKEELLKGLAGVNEPLLISAYTDKVGTDEYNAKLREERAQAVKDFLEQELGLDPSRIRISEGQVMNLSDQFLARRVEVR